MVGGTVGGVKAGIAVWAVLLTVFAAEAAYRECVETADYTPCERWRGGKP